MILGVGTDIVEIKHFKLAFQKSPKILERLFTQKELAQACQLMKTRKIAYYAKRYAAKEAFSKACGTGIGANITWQDIEISNDKRGKPIFKFSTKVQKFLQKKFKYQTVKAFLSLTDEKEYAMAFVVLTN